MDDFGRAREQRRVFLSPGSTISKQEKEGAQPLARTLQSIPDGVCDSSWQIGEVARADLVEPYRVGDLLPLWAMGKFSGNHLYRVRDDPEEEANLAGTYHEKQSAEKLRAALVEMEAPAEQFERLALA